MNTNSGGDDRPWVQLFTDGACSGNPGPGGWAYILRDMRSGAEQERHGGEPRTTNNRMELLSVIEGLHALKGSSRVELYSDSQYVVNGLNEWIDDWKKKGWKRPRNQKVKNLELWQELDRLRAVHEITSHWVRGHDEHPENERCDKLAVAAAERFK
jgi:ribonuclease HI